MPILFKTSVRDSLVHGKGIFAEEDIPAGATWWICDQSLPGIAPKGWQLQPNIIFTSKNIGEIASRMNQEEFIGVLDYTMNYEDGDLMIFLGDGSGVLNHSADCNSQIVYNEDKDYKKLRSVATRDIKKGQEITENYSHYPKMRQEWVIKTFRKYVPTRLDFQTDFNIEKIVR